MCFSLYGGGVCSISCVCLSSVAILVGERTDCLCFSVGFVFVLTGGICAYICSIGDVANWKYHQRLDESLIFFTCTHLRN